MLEIIKGSFYSNAHTVLTERIKSSVSRGKRVYLIVPEQQTVLAEREMAALLPPSAPLTFEVTNFSRFSDTVFRTLGGLTGKYCDKGKRALIMWRTLTELSPLLSMTEGKKEISAGLVERALGAIGELEAAAVGKEELSLALNDEGIKEDKRLFDKISDLEKILALYKSLLTRTYSDAGGALAECTRRISKNRAFLENTEFFIEGFTSFTEQQYNLISELSHSDGITVLLSISHLHREEFPYTEIRDTERRLKNAVRKHGGEVKLTREDSSMPTEHGTLREICDLLWTKSGEFDNITLQNPDELRIFEASTPYEECSFITADIKRRIMAGARYRDFAIIARDADSYAGLLDTALEKDGIRAFFSRKREISSFELIKLIYNAYGAILGNYAREDVITYAKCGLVGISREECDELEEYVNAWSLSGKALASDEVWSMNPKGYTTARSSDVDEKLLRINSAKKKLFSPLLSFARAVRSASTVKEHAEALIGHLFALECEKRLSERAEALALFGEDELARESARIWELVCEALDALVEVSGDIPTDGEGFLSQLKIIFSSYDLSKIPSYLDAVTVGSADMLRLREKKHIYLLGVNAGRFPGAVSESSYFAEKDKLRLSALGLALSPELEIKSARELYIFSRSFAYASESVTLSYSLRDTKQKATPRADVIDTVTRLTRGAVSPVKISSLPLAARIYSHEDALALTDAELSGDKEAVERALLLSGYEKELSVSRSRISGDEMTLGDGYKSAYGDRPLALTQSRIDSYYGCPFAYFCRFTVNLSREVRAEFDASNIGVFVHAVLENFFRYLHKEGNRAADLTVDERIALTDRSTEQYLGEISESMDNASMRVRLKIEKLRRAASAVVDGLVREFSESLFEPRFFELAISPTKEEVPDPVVFDTEDGKKVYVYGIIDRVDTYKHGDDVYVRVVDYKTGRKEFSPEDLSEGKNLQMFLYLRSILESENESFRKALELGETGRVIPAGVIYVKTSVKDVKINTPSDKEALAAFMNAQTREGMVLDDALSLEAMKIKYTPLGTEKKPDVISETKRDLLYTEESLSEVMKTVEDSVMRAAEGIRSGSISPTPLKDGYEEERCARCEFRPICRRMSK